MIPSQSGGAGENSYDLLDFITDNGRNLTERDVRPLAQQLTHMASSTAVRITFLPFSPCRPKIYPIKKNSSPHHCRSQSREHPCPRQLRRTGARGSPFSPRQPVVGGGSDATGTGTGTDKPSSPISKHAATFTAPDSDSFPLLSESTSRKSSDVASLILMARCCEQYSHAPELLQIGIHIPRRGATESEPLHSSRH